jgi:hypothetical protein
MGDHQHQRAGSSPRRADQIQHFGPQGRAKRGEGFVQQQDRAGAQQGPRQRRPAGLTARKLRGAAGAKA